MQTTETITNTPTGVNRRKLLQQLGLGASVAAVASVVGGAALPSVAKADDALDIAVLNFALNLEYLEAEYYLRGVYGRGLAVADQGASPGAVNGGRRVKFPRRSLIAEYATEIAADEENHVKFLRQALGTAAVSAPQIDFTNAFKALGFDPFRNEVNFMLGAFVFEDVGVTAYSGGATLLTNKTYLGAAASILAVEAYHAGTVRNTLYGISKTNRGVRRTVQAISNAREGVNIGVGDKDQTIISSRGRANIVPTDDFGLAFSRSTDEVLRIVYLNANKTVGGFFPAGLNGAVK